MITFTYQQCHRPLSTTLHYWLREDRNVESAAVTLTNLTPGPTPRWQVPKLCTTHIVPVVRITKSGWHCGHMECMVGDTNCSRFRLCSGNFPQKLAGTPAPSPCIWVQRGFCLLDFQATLLSPHFPPKNAFHFLISIAKNQLPLKRKRRFPLPRRSNKQNLKVLQTMSKINQRKKEFLNGGR